MNESVCRAECSTLERCRKLKDKSSTFMPLDLFDLKECFDSQNCAVFQAHNNAEGHATTKSREWLESSNNWKASRALKCFKSNRYEPYVLLAKSMAPKYDERFSGYGKNKIQYIQNLRYKNFRFAILPRGYLIHFPHPRSSAKFRWLLNSKIHRNVDNQYAKFIQEMRSMNPKPLTPVCSHSTGRSRINLLAST